MKIIRIVKLYLRKKDKETAIKKQKEQIAQIVRLIITDRSPKQAITMRNEIEELFDTKMDEQLRESLESVECISNYKKI